MPSTDRATLMQPISAPILVPGTQQHPTTPASSTGTPFTSPASNPSQALPMASTSSLTSLGAAGPSTGGSSTEAVYETMKYHAVPLNPNSAITPTTANTGRLSTLSTGSHHKNGSTPTTTTTTHNNNISNNSNANSGLRRLPSFGNTKKLSLENQTLRAKIAELERYLTGLKEELILAHRQIHAKNLDLQRAAERQSIELHELGQHLQKCELDLMAKSAEVEALQNKLVHQTKEQMSKIKHIDMLETEIMDYRRISVMSGASLAGAGAGARNSMGGAVEFESNEEMGEEGEGGASAWASFAEGVPQQTLHTSLPPPSQPLNAHGVQFKLLRQENQRQEEHIRELLEKVDRLGAEVLNLEREKTRLEQEKSASESSLVEQGVDVKEEKKEEGGGEDPSFFAPLFQTRVPITAEAIIAATTSSRVSLASLQDLKEQPSSSPLPAAQRTQEQQPEQQPTPSGSFHSSSHASINSVGYDISVEHPKLLAKYQALSISHAQASEYLDTLESENQDLKVQLLDVAPAPLTVAVVEPILGAIKGGENEAEQDVVGDHSVHVALFPSPPFLTESTGTGPVAVQDTVAQTS